MAIVVFALSLILLVAGLAGGYMSLDLLPTSEGVLYALGGAVAVAMAVLAFALGVLIRRIDALTELVRQPVAPSMGAYDVLDESPAVVEADEAPPFELETPAEAGEAENAPEILTEEVEDPTNENRAGHLPTLADIEHALETPETPPSLVGRYSAGGANYMIFNDGSIEAETAEGTYKFPSMADFKQFLADRRAGNA
jgi:hypothetical protein